jgi:hypothetical protein
MGAATTTRDVVIRLKIEAEKFKYPAPDYSAAYAGLNAYKKAQDQVFASRVQSAARNQPLAFTTVNVNGGQRPGQFPAYHVPGHAYQSPTSQADAAREQLEADRKRTRDMAAQQRHQAEFGAGIKAGSSQHQSVDWEQMRQQAAKQSQRPDWWNTTPTASPVAPTAAPPAPMSAAASRLNEEKQARAERQMSDREAQQAQQERIRAARRGIMEVKALEAEQKLSAAQGSSVARLGGIPQQGQGANIPGMAGTRSQDGMKNSIGAVGLSGNTQLIYTAGEAYKMAGEGAFHLARGIVFLNASGEQEIAVLVKKIAFYQGQFEVIKGTIDVGNGLMRGTRALAIAHATGASAAALQAGTMSSLQIAMLGARGASIALWTAMTGPLAIGIAATAAVAGIGYLAYDKLTRSSERAAAQALKLATAERDAAVIRIKAINDLNAIYRVGAAAQASYQRQSTVRAALGSGVDADNIDRMRQINADQQANRERNIKGLLGGADKAAGKTGHLGQATGFDYRKNQTAGGYLSANNGNYAKLLDQISKSSPTSDTTRVASMDGLFKKAKDQAEAEKEIVAWREKAVQKLSLELASRKNLASEIQNELGFSKERVSLLTTELERVRAIKTANSEAMKSAQARTASLKADKLTDLQKIGQMNQWDQRNAKQIGMQLAAGGSIQGANLRKDQIDFMRAHGLGNAHLEKYDTDKGKAAGGEKTLENFGQSVISETESLRGGGPAGERREDVAAFQKDFARAGSNDANDALAKIQEQLRESQAKELELLKIMANNDPRIQVLEDAIKDRDADAARLREELAKSLDAAKKQIGAEQEQKRTNVSMLRRFTGGV